jgi:hypothetical protein
MWGRGFSGWEGCEGCAGFFLVVVGWAQVALFERNVFCSQRRAAFHAQDRGALPRGCICHVCTDWPPSDNRPSRVRKDYTLKRVAFSFPPSSRFFAHTRRRFQHYLDKTVIYPQYRWPALGAFLVLYALRVMSISGWYIVTYGLSIYLLNLFIGFLSPQFDPEARADGGIGLPQTNGEEFRPFERKVGEFAFWWKATRASVVAFFMTFFSFFDIPVFWPILLGYFVVLFGLTMRNQISHMLKHRCVFLLYPAPQAGKRCCLLCWGKYKNILSFNAHRHFSVLEVPPLSPFPSRAISLRRYIPFSWGKAKYGSGGGKGGGGGKERRGGGGGAAIPPLVSPAEAMFKGSSSSSSSAMATGIATGVAGGILGAGGAPGGAGATLR